MKKPTTPSEASQAPSTDRTPAEILAELQASFAHSAKLLESMERQLAASTLPLIERPIVWVVREDHPKVQGGVGYVIDNSGRRHWVAKTASSLAIVSKAETLEVLRAINDGVLTTAEAMSLRRPHAPIISPGQVDAEFDALASAYIPTGKAAAEAQLTAANREQQEPDFWASPCDRTTATSGLTLGRGMANKKLVPAVEVGFVRANVISTHTITLATAKALRDQLNAILND